MRGMAFAAAAACVLFASGARAEVDEARRDEVVDTVRRIVESHEAGGVTIESPEGRAAATREEEEKKDDHGVVITRREADAEGEGGGGGGGDQKKAEFRADLDLRKTPVSDAIDAFGRMSGITIILDPKALADVGDVPINLKVSDMPLGTAMRWICRLAGLDYELRDGAIFVSTPARLGEKTATMAVYDVRDLISAVEDFPGPTMNLDKEGLTINQFGR